MLRRCDDLRRQRTIVGFLAGHIAVDAAGIAAMECGDRL
jgi:hypothetical protein